MEFKAIKLLGNRVYLELPKQEESKILIVEHNTKEDLQREMLRKLSNLKVFAVGDLVNTISVGDDVLVDPGALAKAHLIPLNDDVQVALVSVFDIVHIWNKIEG